MASIDKTYTSYFKEYDELREWMKDKVVTFYDGYKVRIYDFLYQWTKEDFVSEDGFPINRPVMNTPTWLDIYLIQNCPVEFVQYRMKEVYPRGYYEKFKKLEFPTKPDSSYAKNRKIVITRNSRTRVNLANKTSCSWWIDCEDSAWWYNTESKKWSSWKDYYPWDTNVMYCKTIKSLIRQLRQSYLPKGLKFRLLGRYDGENYTITIK